jgi:hypothetical protein
MLSEDPHVMAVASGDNRYREAVKAVEDAQRELEEYRDDLTIQRDLGTKSWAEGLKPRREAVRLAQEALAKISGEGQGSGRCANEPEAVPRD